VTNCGLGWGCCYGDHGCDCSKSSVSHGVGYVQTNLASSGVLKISNAASTTSSSSEIDTISTSNSASRLVPYPLVSAISTFPNAGMSTTIKIGIVLGTGIGVLMLIVSMVIFQRLRRRRTGALREKDTSTERRHELHSVHLLEADSNAIH
jgi:hypothetical protein